MLPRVFRLERAFYLLDAWLGHGHKARILDHLRFLSRAAIRLILGLEGFASVFHRVETGLLISQLYIINYLIQEIINAFILSFYLYSKRLYFE